MSVDPSSITPSRHERGRSSLTECKTKTKLDFTNQGILVLTTKEVTQIFLKFKYLYSNRVYYQGLHRKPLYID